MHVSEYYCPEKQSLPVASAACERFASTPSAATSLYEAPLGIVATISILALEDENNFLHHFGQCRLESEVQSTCEAGPRYMPEDPVALRKRWRSFFHPNTRCGLSLLRKDYWLGYSLSGGRQRELALQESRECWMERDRSTFWNPLPPPGPYVLTTIGEGLYFLPSDEYSKQEIHQLRLHLDNPLGSFLTANETAKGLDDLEEARIPREKGDCACDAFFQGACAYLKGKIFFYPRANKGAESVLLALAKILDDWRRFYEDAPSTTNARLFCPPNNGKILKEPQSSEMSLTLISLINSAALYNNCSVPLSDRIIGFDTEREAKEAAIKFIKAENLEYERRIRNSKRSNENPTPSLSGTDRLVQTSALWALVDFSGTDPVAAPSRVRYKLHVHKRNVPERKSGATITQRIDFGLQTLLDEAVMLAKTGRRPSYAIETRRLPESCRTVHAAAVYGQVLLLLLSFLTMLSFVLLPAQYLEQVLTEKALRMREYLCIMGVSRRKLQGSWLLFYAAFMVPVSLAYAALLVSALPGDLLGRTSVSLLFVLLLLYNAAQLGFCTALGAVMEKPQRTAVLTAAIAVFFWILAAYSFSRQLVPAQRLWLARLASLHPVVPLTLALIYVCTWEQRWLGADWTRFLRPPVMEDQYNGLAECMAWLVLDTILYFILAWYLESVWPGEFGVAEPWYFPMRPAYWLSRRPSEIQPNKAELDAEFSTRSGDFKAAHSVTLRGLTKIYEGTKAGVRGLSLRFHEGEITAFLGQNGAGKSTTLNMMVGLIPPTKGDAFVGGLSIRHHMKEIRQLLGYVPQYDILYPDMTVAEHLKFFGWLKGMSTVETEKRTSVMLSRLGLQYSTSTTCTKLSGGQQRKLSILTAYMGCPRVVILDEPTSGVDPFSRRHIWDWVLERKARTTTLLSTHFMDEADILGDRLAIIADGRLCCSGSPLALKSKFGQGFTLSLTLGEAAQADVISEFVARNVPDSSLLHVKDGELAFDIPMLFAQSGDMVPFLRVLEANKATFGVVGLGLSEPTVEDVFFAVTKASRSQELEALTVAAESKISEHHAGAPPLPLGAESGPRLWMRQAAAVSMAKLLGLRTTSGLLLQFGIPLSFIFLFLVLGDPTKLPTTRKAHLQTPYGAAFFLRGAGDGIVAAVRQGLGAERPPWTGLGAVNGSGRRPLAALNLSRPCPACSSPPELFHRSCEQDVAKATPHFATGSGHRLYLVPESNNLDDWIVRANASDSIIVGGFQFGSRRAQKETIRAGLGKTLEHIDDTARPDGLTWEKFVNSRERPDLVTLYAAYGLEDGVLNAWSNLQYRLLAEAEGSWTEFDPDLSIETTIEERDFFEDVAMQGRLEGKAWGRLVPTTMGTIFVSLSFIFAIYAATISAQMDTISGLKRVQFLYGLRPWVYWVVNLMWDLACLGLLALVVGVLLTHVPNAMESFAAELCLGMAVSGLMGLPFAYVLTLCREKPAGILTPLALLTFVGFILGAVFLVLAGSWYSCHLVIRINLKGSYSLQSLGYTQPSSCDEYLGMFPIINDVLRIFPPACMSEIVSLLVCRGVVEDLRLMLYEFDPDPDEGFDNVRALFPLSTEYELYAWESMGKRLTTAVVGGFVYLVIAIMLDTFDLRLSMASLRPPPRAENSPSPFRLVDEDVNAEKKRVMDGRADGSNLVLKDVTKIYPGRTNAAVAGVTVAVPPGQCFGLLGINGAGKSTLFRLLTGFETPTFGSADLMGRPLMKQHAASSWGRFRGASYCPQENTLFGGLSARQHLRHFALLRGLAWDAATKTAVAGVLRELGLEAQAAKPARTLSGGNQRKVQLGMALLGRPDVLFLDEPTSGMDPGARRRAWDAIGSAVSAGAAVVLTSHSMDECEALCGRLAIMVSGGFQCLGSAAALKAKFGGRLRCRAKLRTASLAESAEVGETPGERVRELLERRYPQARLLEAHATLLHYELPASGLELSSVYATLEEARESGDVEDFMVGETGLEAVFVSMASLQEHQADGVVLNMAAQAQAPTAKAAPGVATTTVSGDWETALLSAVAAESDMLTELGRRGDGLQSPLRGRLRQQRTLVGRLLGGARVGVDVGVDPMSEAAVEEDAEPCRPKTAVGPRSSVTIRPKTSTRRKVTSSGRPKTTVSRLSSTTSDELPKEPTTSRIRQKRV